MVEQYRARIDPELDLTPTTTAHLARTSWTYGPRGGPAFRQGAGNLDEIIATTKASGAVYVGDLDPAGAAILLGVNGHRRSIGQSAVRPHRGVYLWLLAHGCRRPLETPPAPDLLTRLTGLFPFELARGLLDLWKTGYRIPQESFGLEQLCGRDDGIAQANAS